MTGSKSRPGKSSLAQGCYILDVSPITSALLVSMAGWEGWWLENHHTLLLHSLQSQKYITIIYTHQDKKWAGSWGKIKWHQNEQKSLQNQDNRGKKKLPCTIKIYTTVVIKVNIGKVKPWPTYKLEHCFKIRKKITTRPIKKPCIEQNSSE